MTGICLGTIRRGHLHHSSACHNKVPSLLQHPATTEQHTNSLGSSGHDRDDGTGTDDHDGACYTHAFFLLTLQAAAHHFLEYGNKLVPVRSLLQKQY